MAETGMTAMAAEFADHTSAYIKAPAEIARRM